jgi:nucleotide sugar dehydrogenase
VHLTHGTREAEAAKILENTQRQVNIALVNEFAQLCHHMGVDVWDTLAAAATKPFAYTPYKPGPGVGGHCIPADPMYLVHRAGEMGMPFRLAQAAQDINDGMPLWVADRICKHLEDVGIDPADADILLLGVTYKPDIADTRNTPATAIITELRGRGALVRFHDPYITELDGCAPAAPSTTGSPTFSTTDPARFAPNSNDAQEERRRGPDRDQVRGQPPLRPDCGVHVATFHAHRPFHPAPARRHS